MSDDDLKPTERADDGRTPLVDPGSRPRIPHAADAAREPALFDRQPIGPLRGRVKVTPIRRHDRAVFFEVSATWGPNADGSDVVGLARLPAHQVADALFVAGQEDALRVARAAVDVLRTPQPDQLALDLPALARRLGVELQT